MVMYKLEVKLDGVRPTLSRTVLVPEDIDFAGLDHILRTVFSLSYFHLSLFNIDGLNTPIWDFEKTYPSTRAVDMNGRAVADYFTMFKRCLWAYDLSGSWTFTIKIKKTKVKKDYPLVESFEGEYNPIEDCHVSDFQDMLEYTLEGVEFPDWLPDFEMEKFDIGKTNSKLKEL